MGSSFLHAKYGRGRVGLSSLIEKQGSSFIWRGLVSANPLVSLRGSVGWVENGN